MLSLPGKTIIIFFALVAAVASIAATISSVDGAGRAAPTGTLPAAGAAAAYPQPPPVHKFALIIGINYDHTDFGEVKYADRDALSIYNLLTKQKGFPPGNIAMLRNSQATRGNILAALGSLAANPEVDSHSEVVFFYSGHGLRNGPGDGPDITGLPPGYALVPFDFYNYNWKQGAGLIWNRELAAALSRIHPGMMWVSIDSCFSGGFIQPGIAGPDRVVTASSQADQLSNELPQAQQGVFTDFMVNEGLARGMSIEQAFNSASIRSLPYSQTPQIADEVPGGGGL